MKKVLGRVTVTLVILAMTFSIPIATKVINTQADDSWNLVWSDEFGGTSLNTKNWTCETGTGEWGWGNNEQQYYLGQNSNNVEVSDGTLKIHAFKQSYGGKNYTSARMKTAGKQSFRYGKIEAMIKLPRFKGSWPAFWMLGDSINNGTGWPACGEIDIMEAINDENQVYSTLHWSKNNEHSSRGGSYSVADRTQWHKYGMIWDADKIKFYVDDKLARTITISDEEEMQEFRQKHFIILNLAIGGEWPRYDIDDNAFPDKSTMEVDYVRVYEKVEGPTTAYNGPTKTVTQDAVAEYQGTWTNFIGTSWLGATGTVTANGSKASDGFTANITKVGSYNHNDAVWSVQGKLENMQFYTGSKYRFECDITSDKNKTIYVKVADGDENNVAGGYIDLVANQTYHYAVDVEIPSDFESTLSLKYGLGNNSYDKSDENENFNISVRNVSFKTTTTIPDIQPTTKSSNVNKPTAKKATKPTVAKTKIKKVIKKKKSLKIKLKKIKGVRGYHVMYSDDKSFMAYDEKYVKKATFKIKGLERKTKYYIKARGYKVVNKKYYFGKFSKKKKVKTK